MKKVCIWLICTILFVITGCANTKKKTEAEKTACGKRVLLQKAV